ncbi:MAG: hypothetical protein K5880_19750 [Hydrogenophaga sp.]|uniref:sulfatase-like hydrolase/transferase n=1 Tax=Hydrogenophaga sp. TaxID=1904254 RepID=UPI002631C94B|nr:sulfatase-like hydrolase/transferase [Hydrogenophaga sp.]MCV0440832.1 hypothetical protein [Hydrogenophaga sp.]
MNTAPPCDVRTVAPRAALAWLLRFGAAFVLLNTLLTFENLWPGFGVRTMPRLSFELCLAVVALMAWVAWRGRLSARAATLLALGFVALVVARYADVTAPAVLGRPVNVYWDGRHALELLRVAAQAAPAWQVVAALLVLPLGALLIGGLARAAIVSLSRCLQSRAPRPWLLTAVAALTLSFAAYEPDRRDTRWFFSLPLAPTLLHQARLLAGVWLPGRDDAVLGASPAFDGTLSGLVGEHGPADVLLVFAESYGAGSFDQPAQAAALAVPRQAFVQAIQEGGRAVVSARVSAPTYGGASWLSHAALLAGVDTRDPAAHDLLLTSDRPTLVRHFARHGYRTVGWMPGLKRPWPEGAFYGFDRLADDAGIGYAGPDFGYWRIPDQAAMALLQAQELGAAAVPQGHTPRFAVFPTTSTHAPFHPLPPFVPDATRLRGPDAYTPEQVSAARAAPLSARDALPRYLESLRYQYAWLAQLLRQPSPRPLLMVIVGDHQPPALAGGRSASWDVPVHVVSDDRALLQRLLGNGFVPGVEPPGQAIGPMHGLTQVLLNAFDGPGAHGPVGIEQVAAPPATLIHPQLPAAAPGS